MRSATVFAPATVSNVAVGFDILGFAVEAAGDEVTVTVSERAGVRVEAITDTTGTLPEGAIPYDASQNTATVGLIKLREDLRLDYGFDVSIRKGIALGSGMGGSAASAVAALVAANSLLERPLPQESLLAYALVAERVASGAAHPDNAAPCLFGGLTLMLSADPARHVELPVPTGVLNVLVHPHVRVDTRDARGILKDSVTLADHVRQSANLGGFIAGCFRDDLELIRSSLTDIIIEPQRAALIPGFNAVKAAALREGAIGVSISGSGPSVFAWVDSESASERVRAAMVSAFMSNGVTDVDSWVSPVSREGARVIG
ncbi:MAG: homoserine kinase [Acidobacteriota bacterium]|jgi:homoserine kinase|nr:homoserine kinase [Acidobacteriota bacterium]